MLTDPTHVIILAQGSQKRMGEYTLPKQLLPLSAHVAARRANTVLLERTIAQVARIMIGKDGTLASLHDRSARHQIVVIAGQDVSRYTISGHLRDFGAHDPKTASALVPDLHVHPTYHELSSPGNSSLKGLGRVLDEIRDNEYADPFHRRVVLLGDVLYSWACLEALFRPADVGDVTFAGTSDLGPGGGELWGVSWFRSTAKLIDRAMEMALKAHSKFEDEYQPGQLRHLLWSVDHIINCDPPRMARDWWVPIDDYTMDVDLPEHIAKLAQHSFLALADDKEHGLG